MNLDAIRSDLRILSELIAGWDSARAIPSLERDLALEKLRGLYESLRFGAEPTVPADAAESADIDLGDILSLDADFPAADAAPAAADADRPAPAAPVAAEPQPAVAEPSVSQGASPQTAPAAKKVANTLFGPEDELVRHRHKQRVIMSLYGDTAPVSRIRPAVSEPASGPVPAAEPAAEPAVEPAAEPVVAVPAQPAAEPIPVSEPAARTQDPAPDEPVGTYEIVSVIESEEEISSPADVPFGAAEPADPNPGEAPRAEVDEEPVGGVREGDCEPERCAGGEEPSDRVEPRTEADGPDADAEPADSASGPRIVAVLTDEEEPAGERPDDGNSDEEEPDFIELTVDELVAGISAAPEAELAPSTAEPAEEPAAEPVAVFVAEAEPENPVAESAAGTILGEVINRNVQTLGDTLAAQRDAAAERRLAEPVGDLKRAIGINDKFLMIRDLFGGDGAAFDVALDALNACADFDDCMIHIAENYAWNPDSDGAKLLVELLERKYA